MSGRFDAYICVGMDVAHMHKLDVNWDDKYRSQYEQQLSKIADLEKSRNIEDETLNERIRKGLISPSDKKKLKRTSEKNRQRIRNGKVET